MSLIPVLLVVVPFVPAAVFGALVGYGVVRVGEGDG